MRYAKFLYNFMAFFLFLFVAQSHAAGMQFMVVHTPQDTEKLVKITESDSLSIDLVESLSATDKTFSVVTANSLEALQSALAKDGIKTLQLIAIKDINSPTRAGGSQAGVELRDGHQSFVIQRKIPGVGDFPDHKKKVISAKSNTAIMQIGDPIEWKHSYLTEEGTFCVYRATDESKIREHGELAGAPITTITPVSENVAAASR